VRAAARLEGVSEGLAERSWREFYARRLPGGPTASWGWTASSTGGGRCGTGLRDLKRALPVAFVSEEGRRLAAALLADGRLARAWGLKESLRSLYRLPRLEQAEAALGRWLQEAEASGLAPFQRTARTLERWQREVLNCWRYPIRGALVGGKHNRVKALKRRGYGYRNEGSFLLRILSHIYTD